MLRTILAVVLVMWLLCFTFHVGGGLIHLLLLVAVVVFLIDFIAGRRRLA